MHRSPIIALASALILLAACAGEKADREATVSPEATATLEATQTPTQTVVVQPEIGMGDTIGGVGGNYDTPGFTMTLLSWLESDIAVDGPYIDGYYTFTAKPGMKFVIVQYKLSNDWVKQQETPYLDAGEIVTAPSGYYYQVWNPPLGARSEEYAPSRSTKEEVNRLGGDEGGFQTLLPGEWTTGRVVFEIPKDMTPVGAQIAYVPAKITFAR